MKHEPKECRALGAALGAFLKPVTARKPRKPRQVSEAVRIVPVDRRGWKVEVDGAIVGRFAWTVAGRFDGIAGTIFRTIGDARTWIANEMPVREKERTGRPSDRWTVAR